MLMEFVNHSITVAIVILAVIILRNIFGNRISPVFRYALWLLVVLKLFVPFTFVESGYGLNGLVENSVVYFQSIINEKGSNLQSDQNNLNGNLTVDVEHAEEIGFSDASLSSAASIVATEVPEGIISENSDVSGVSGKQRWKTPWNHSEMITEMILISIWLAGALIFALIMLFCNAHMYLKVKKRRILLEEDIPVKVYICDYIKVPCLFGFFRPSIYLTEECLSDEKMKKQILTHEYVHYKQKDHIWSMIRSIVLAFYWYHPFVWAAVRLSGTDSELSCDWKTIKILGEENRADYGRTLIKISCEKNHQKNPFMCATGITNNANELKKRLKIMVSNTKKSILLAIVALLVSLCLAGFVFGKEENESMVLLEVPEHPLSAEVLTAAIEAAGLEWEITDEQSWMENQRAFTLSDKNGSMVASVASTGDENGRSLMFGFMSKRNEPTDTVNNIQVPVTEEEFLKALEMAAVLYGDLESETQIAEDFQKNFEEKATIKDIDANGKIYADNGFLTYSRSGKWESKYGNVNFRANFGYMNDTGEIDYQSIGLYNSGDYILFVDDMEEGEVFEAKPEIEINDISEEEFISAYEKAYHEETTEFYYNQTPGIYRFFEVQIKDTEYCPEYPFDIKMYFGVNLSESENNLDRAFIFENEREDYSFLPTAVNYGFSVAPDVMNGGKLLSGRFGIGRLILKDENGEVIQHKKYNYSTTFEIQISEEELQEEEFAGDMDILKVLYSIPEDAENVVEEKEEYEPGEMAVSTTYETRNASVSLSKDAATGEIFSVSCIDSDINYASGDIEFDEEIVEKNFDKALTIYSLMCGTDNEFISGAYYYTRNSANEIHTGSVNYVFEMENGDFIEIWYNMKHDVFWQAVRFSDYKMFLKGWEELAVEGVAEKENKYDFVFVKVFDYTKE